MSVTVSEIRARYPDPKTAIYHGSFPLSPLTRITGYCVGGALCLYRGHTTEQFPSKLTLSRILREANPDLTIDESKRMAHFIVCANDLGLFDRAWEGLEEALAWKRGGSKSESELSHPESEPEPACV